MTRLTHKDVQILQRFADGEIHAPLLKTEGPRFYRLAKLGLVADAIAATSTPGTVRAGHRITEAGRSVLAKETSR